MATKDIFLSNITNGTSIEISLMILRIIFKDTSKIVCILVDKTGEIKATIPCKNSYLKEGMVIKLQGKKDINFEVKSYEVLKDFDIYDYLPCVKRPVEEIMAELEELTTAYIKSPEAKALNDYFFKDEGFLDKFKRAIGGVSMHHNYIGGLAEHTLGVMKLASVFCDTYNCRRTEIAVLAAKLHDIGKIYEIYYEGPFKYTLQGELEGHIVIGIQLIDRAINEMNTVFSDDFVARIKGCVVQHHGKLEYGSPREARMEEAFIVNIADSTDATLNKINLIKSKTEENKWSEYDRRIETKLYL